MDLSYIHNLNDKELLIGLSECERDACDPPSEQYEDLGRKTDAFVEEIVSRFGGDFLENLAQYFTAGRASIDEIIEEHTNHHERIMKIGRREA